MEWELSVFSGWLACGVLGALVVCPARMVNSGYYRSTCLVVLGMLVLALLSGWNTCTVWTRGLLLLGAVGAYVAYAAWHLERQHFAVPCQRGLFLVLLSVVLLQAGQPSFAGAASIATALAATWLLGASMGAMLLGHYYLTAPWMSLLPLQRLTLLIGAGALLQAVAAGWALAENWSFFGVGLANLAQLEWWLYFGLRWGAGIVAPMILTYMVWQTLNLKATQAATGILYVIVIFTMLGEAAALVISRIAGVSL